MQSRTDAQKARAADCDVRPRPMHTAPRRSTSLSAVTALLMVASACTPAAASDSDAERKTILERAPLGSPVTAVGDAMKPLGFSCSKGQGQFTDESGKVHASPEFIWCDRQQRAWW